MKLLLSLFALCLVIMFSQSSCTKDVPVPVTDTLVVYHVDTLFNSDTIYVTQPSSIYGLWIGTYDIVIGGDAGAKDLYYSYELHTDHTIQMTGVGADGLTYYGLGTWSVDGTAFTAHFVTTNLGQAGAAQTATATYDSTKNKLSGIVVDDYGAPYQQTFDLEKVQ